MSGPRSWTGALPGAMWKQWQLSRGKLERESEPKVNNNAGETSELNLSFDSSSLTLNFFLVTLVTLTRESAYPATARGSGVRQFILIRRQSATPKLCTAADFILLGSYATEKKKIPSCEPIVWILSCSVFHITPYIRFVKLNLKRKFIIFHFRKTRKTKIDLSPPQNS